MTDEQLGRAWCERNGKRPDHYPRTGLPPWRWTCDDGTVYLIPYSLAAELGLNQYETEADAYADLGQALRAVARHCDDLRPLEGES